MCARESVKKCSLGKYGQLPLWLRRPMRGKAPPWRTVPSSIEAVLDRSIEVGIVVGKSKTCRASKWQSHIDFALPTELPGKTLQD
jgi:hypothetical protein